MWFTVCWMCCLLYWRQKLAGLFSNDHTCCIRTGPAQRIQCIVPLTSHYMTEKLKVAKFRGLKDLVYPTMITEDVCACVLAFAPWSKTCWLLSSADTGRLLLSANLQYFQLVLGCPNNTSTAGHQVSWFTPCVRVVNLRNWSLWHRLVPEWQQQGVYIETALKQHWNSIRFVFCGN